MKNIKQEELNKILKEHELWLKGEGWERADLNDTNLNHTNLRFIDLRRADLRGTNLRYTNLNYANLEGANLEGADLSDTNLRYSDLSNANLNNVNFKYADLSNADLSYANLRGANLEGANLKCADLRYADLEYVKTNMHTIGYNLACPEKGSFIGYKKASEYLIELLILDDAKRSSATTTKCRTNKVKVLEIRDIRTGKKVNEVNSDYDNSFIYKVGEIVSVDNFDNNRWNECTSGIHFFMNREDAINY